MADMCGVDGCVIAVLQEVVKSPEKEREFRAALASVRDGVPKHIAAIRALNSIYADSKQITEIDASVLGISMKGPVGEYLSGNFDCQLPVHPGMELTFLNSLVEYADSRMEILNRYRQH